MVESLTEIQNKLRQVNPHTQILAVSKLQSVEKIKDLYLQGQRFFAENYVQEALNKQDQIDRKDIHWHLIGHIQKNKAKLTVGRFDLIHSVDSTPLAQALNKVAEAQGLQQKVLLQINMAEETSKGGFSPRDFLSHLPALKQCSSLQICGLMTMPPLFEDPEKARPFFRELKNIFLSIKSDFPQLRELSMGTSSDYLVAAEEGATLVRLGTILFGKR